MDYNPVDFKGVGHIIALNTKPERKIIVSGNFEIDYILTKFINVLHLSFFRNSTLLTEQGIPSKGKKEKVSCR